MVSPSNFTSKSNIAYLRYWLVDNFLKERRNRTKPCYCAGCLRRFSFIKLINLCGTKYKHVLFDHMKSDFISNFNQHKKKKLKKEDFT